MRDTIAPQIVALINSPNSRGFYIMRDSYVDGDFSYVTDIFSYVTSVFSYVNLDFYN